MEINFVQVAYFYKYEWWISILEIDTHNNFQGSLFLIGYSSRWLFDIFYVKYFWFKFKDWWAEKVFFGE